MDAAHPAMAAEPSWGWIQEGVARPVEQTASRTRVNGVGAIELKSMNVLSECAETVRRQLYWRFSMRLKRPIHRPQRFMGCWVNPGITPVQRLKLVRFREALRCATSPTQPKFKPDRAAVESDERVCAQQRIFQVCEPVQGLNPGLFQSNHPQDSTLAILPNQRQFSELAGLDSYRGSMAGLCVPLSTLHAAPHDTSRMPREQYESLLLYCLGLSPVCSLPVFTGALTLNRTGPQPTSAESNRRCAKPRSLLNMAHQSPSRSQNQHQTAQPQQRALDALSRSG